VVPARCAIDTALERYFESVRCVPILCLTHQQDHLIFRARRTCDNKQRVAGERQNRRSVRDAIVFEAMGRSSVEHLDAAELLHLGLHASQHEDPARAIEYLKRCLVLEPQNSNAIYLLGALYAQIGIYDRAKDALARAVELDASQYTAIFQLGLLYLTSGEVAQAEHYWQRMEVLGADSAFNLFRFGLLALVKDDFAGCVAYLDRGIAANTFNETLNLDMQKIKTSAEAALERLSSPLVSAPIPTEPIATGQHLLGNYLQSKRH
jgi:tetratricopeptide (TPR) repeat protein